MIIHEPEILIKDGRAISWARVETSQKSGFFPENIWYRVAEEHASFLGVQSDVFLVASILGAMYYGEDVWVRGSVSPRLAYRLDEYQHVMNLRAHGQVKRVSVHYDKLSPLSAQPKGVGTTFSGGVDSLFTVWSHLSERQLDPDHQITHGIFVRGFDIVPSDREKYDRLFERFNPKAAEIGVKLIELETNFLSVTHHRLDSPRFYGPSIVSCGLALPNLLQRFYTPSSWDHRSLMRKAYSSDPLVDGFLSTDTMEIVHHGSIHRRIEKIMAISDWDLAHELLFVCLEPKLAGYPWNCSRCEKCNRTMIPLYGLGKLEKFKSFQKPIKKNWQVLWFARKFSMKNDFVSEIFLYLKKRKPDVLPWLLLTVFLGAIRYLVVTNLPEVFKKLLRPFGFYVNPNDSPTAYEVEEITQLLREQNSIRAERPVSGR